MKDFLRIQKVLVTAGDSSLAAAEGVLTGGDWNPLKWHWREMLGVAQTAAHIPAHPASNTYYSATPIRFGRYVAKYRVQPGVARIESYMKLMQRLGTEDDALRLALEETLRAQEVLFELQIQLRVSDETMPVEDPTIEWPESESPFRTVAHLLLPRQEISGLRHQNEFHSLAFNVWHALAAHRPLGGINRIRRSAYPISAAWRRQQTEPMCASVAPEDDAERLLALPGS